MNKLITKWNYLTQLPLSWNLNSRIQIETNWDVHMWIIGLEKQAMKTCLKSDKYLKSKKTLVAISST